MLPALGSLESSRRDRDIQTGLYHRGRHTVPRAGGREESKWLCLEESRKAPERVIFVRALKGRRNLPRREGKKGREMKGGGGEGEGREEKRKEGKGERTLYQSVQSEKTTISTTLAQRL